MSSVSKHKISTLLYQASLLSILERCRAWLACAWSEHWIQSECKQEQMRFSTALDVTYIQQDVFLKYFWETVPLSAVRSRRVRTESRSLVGAPPWSTRSFKPSGSVNWYRSSLGRIKQDNGLFIGGPPRVIVLPPRYHLGAQRMAHPTKGLVNDIL